MSYLRCRAHQIDCNDIKAARLIGDLIDVVVPFGDSLELFLLTDIDKVFGFTTAIIASGFDLDENKSVAIHCDNIYFADIPIMKITLNDTEALFDEIATSLVLSEISVRYARCSALSMFHVRN